MGTGNSVLLENLPDLLGLEDIRQVVGDIDESIQELFDKEKDEVNGQVKKEVFLKHIAQRNKASEYQGDDGMDCGSD